MHPQRAHHLNLTLDYLLRLHRRLPLRQNYDMMNAPGPSFVFQSMAVTLEERITRERISIGVGMMDAQPTTPPPPVSEQVMDTMAMEAQLRQLVLASRKKKPKSTLTTFVEVSTLPVAPQPLEDVSMKPAAVVTPPSTPSSSKSSEQHRQSLTVPLMILPFFHC